MSLSLLAALALSAAEPPKVVVFLSRRTGVPAPDAAALVLRVADAGKRDGWTLGWEPKAGDDELKRKGLKDSTACSGRRACLAELGRQLEASFVVAVSTGQIGADRSVAVELFRVADEQVQAKDALVLTPNAELNAELLRPFLEGARPLLVPPPEPPVEPTPPPTPPPSLLPTQPSAPPPAIVVAPPPPPPKSHGAGLALLAGGGATLVAGGVALGFGLDERARALARLPGDPTRSPLTASEAQGHADTANALLGVSVALAATALGLGLGAVLAW